MAGGGRPPGLLVSLLAFSFVFFGKLSHLGLQKVLSLFVIAMAADVWLSSCVSCGYGRARMSKVLKP